MSGIAGIYCLADQTVAPEKLVQMTDRLSHRGPDDSGTWHHGSIGLGHRMLWTTPESLLENLPFVSTDGQRVITADARIDNREELITAFNLSAPFEQIADSELILHAYERWGEHCPEHLIGDFAFALWDDERQHLFCARDHMGIKPLYYFHSDTLFAFASEIKALFCLPEVPRELNESQLACHLVSNYEDHEATLYRAIIRLPAAHTISVGLSSIDLHRYWSLNPVNAIRFETNEEYEQAFREIFTEAVRCRLRSAFPVGSELSGGLDSSSVTCVARQLLSNEGHGALLHTFSHVLNEVPECDERPYISAVLAIGDTEPHFINADQFSPLIDIERRLAHADEASGVSASSFAMWALNKAVKDSKVRILLSGEGGDIVVSYGDQAVFDYISSLDWRRALTDLHRSQDYYFASTRDMIKREIVLPIVPQLVRTASRRLRHSTENVARDYYHVRLDFARRTGLFKRLEADFDQRSKIKNSRQHHYYHLNWGLLQLAIENRDKMAAAHSIEPRYPFFDRRVVEFCLALPPEQKRHDGYTRAIERYALPVLPPAVRWRLSKGSADPYIWHLLRKFERTRVENILCTHSRPIEPYFDLSSLRCAYRREAEIGETDATPTWNALILGLWLCQIDLTH